MVMSAGSRCMDTERDIDLRRTPGLRGAFSYLGRLFRLWPTLRDFDVVQLINPNFLELRPGKIRYFLKELASRNGHVCLSLAGSDPVTVKGCVEDGLFRYSEFRVGEEKSPYARAVPGIERRWLNGVMGDHCRMVYDMCEAAMSALYEYHVAAAPYLGDRLTYTGISVDLGRVEETPFAIPADGKVTLLVGIKSECEVFKGTDRLLESAGRWSAGIRTYAVCAWHAICHGCDWLRELRGAHVLLDQLYSYTPATAALEAMAMGKVVVGGAEPEYLRFIGDEGCPVVNVTPDMEQTVGALESLVTDPERMRRLAGQGRPFVSRHNSASVVADRFLEAWERL